MSKALALKIIFGISIAGMLFSGYLSYSELIKNSCTLGGCSYMLGAPVCVYGFTMYTIVFIFSIWGWRAKK